MKRRTKFIAAKEAKRRSRETVGAVPRTKVIPDKRGKKKVEQDKQEIQEA